MNVKATFMVAFIMTVSGPSGVMSQTCDPDVDEYMEVDDAFGASFSVLETLNNIGRRQCHQTCYDVDICHYVRYDSIHLTCELLESDEGYLNFDEEDCDYNVWAPRNTVCFGPVQRIILHSGNIVCYEKEFENIALHSSGYLSSAMVDYPFEYAVDGITTNDNAHARTNFEDFPYLVLDFGRNVSIDRVEIFGILDAPYFQHWPRLHDVEVRVGMTDEWEFMEYCNYFMGPDPDLIKVDIYCDQCLVGQYVVFKIVSTDYLGEGNNALVVKEVKVYGR